ncbi:hydantoinase B/oxoprolinase family protein [Aeromicrobium camelliae]|uniref:Hydantoinase B/oxoprolinase family protein n=1 Tax=Aeromicrobium camelliae TaxID=1538144 RepID=A0A3N6X2I6_9ACTN|nr:hydantoinase B/oxoprolinase family protein [Aeromicrobium camelliae]RQN07863.1 hydantoinase B/oxoprolinase family protein [Aeromicrobium camelliae]
MSSNAITLEVIRHSLLAGAEEMARNLCRTAYNTVVYEIHDYGIGLHDANGDVVADAPGIAIFTRGNDHGIKKSIEYVGAENMAPGDVFIVNHPYWSSAHTLDPLVFAPIHVDGELIGFSSCRIHVLDLKQKNPGYVLDSVDAYEEGLVFPASRLYRAGEPNDDILNLIRFNSRMPERTIGDIQAQVSACVTGVRRMQEVAAKYGTQELLDAMVAINEHGEKLARLALAKLPKGTWSAEDFVDSDGIDRDTLVKMKATVTITDDEMIVDWTGSATDVKGPINLPVGQTEALSSLVFKAITTPDSPVVAGNFAPLRVVTEPGSVMHAVHPMPTFTLWTGLLAGEVVLKALAQGMPDRIPACSGGDVSSMMGWGTDPRTGEAWLEATNEAVGFGAHAGGDGEDGIMHLSEPGCRNNPVEVLEMKAPLFIESYGYVPDSGGAGRFRGGVGVNRTYRFEADSTGICLVYKTKSAPWALEGGQEAVPARIVLDGGTSEERVLQGGTYPRPAGTTLANITGGGGGYGDPLERDPARVLEDVIDGFVSRDKAAELYGVVIDDAFTIDHTATAERREAARATA